MTSQKTETRGRYERTPATIAKNRAAARAYQERLRSLDHDAAAVAFNRLAPTLEVPNSLLLDLAKRALATAPDDEARAAWEVTVGKFIDASEISTGDVRIAVKRVPVEFTRPIDVSPILSAQVDRAFDDALVEKLAEEDR